MLGGKVKKNKNKKTPILREELLLNYIKGKEVLDLGCVDNQPLTNFKIGKLHKFLALHARHVVGVDCNKKGVEYLRKKGYDVLCGNAENIQLNKKFDVVVGGELIEHVSNQGIFLDNIYNVLKKNGKLIITTPNAFSLRNILRQIFLGAVPTNKEHTLWHNCETLKNLLTRHNFKIVKMFYIFDDFESIKGKLERLLVLISLRKKLRPRIIVVAKKV